MNKKNGKGCLRSGPILTNKERPTTNDMKLPKQGHLLMSLVVREDFRMYGHTVKIKHVTFNLPSTNQSHEHWTRKLINRRNLPFPNIQETAENPFHKINLSARNHSLISIFVFTD